MSSNAPIATVYVRNLEERVRPEPLRDALTAVFSEFGNVIDIVAKTNIKAKGQAFIVYDEPAAAQRAVDEAQGFPLFEKPMVLALARSRSDATVQRFGTEEEFEVHKRRRMAERDKRKALEAAEGQKRLLQRPLGMGLGPGAVPVAAVGAAGGAAAAAAAAAASGAAAAGIGAPGGAAGQPATAHIPDEYLPPNKTLFVQNLPPDCDVEALTEIFGRYEGFREVRMVPGRRGLAFVEYDAEPGAITAKENVADMVLGEGDDKRAIKVTYQRQ